MKERWLGYALLALGGLALLPSGGYAAWFWVGLVAGGFLLAYVGGRNYGFLLVGCVLTGVSVGFLLEGAWNLARRVSHLPRRGVFCARPG